MSLLKVQVLWKRHKKLPLFLTLHTVSSEVYGSLYFLSFFLSKIMQHSFFREMAIFTSRLLWFDKFFSNIFLIKTLNLLWPFHNVLTLCTYIYNKFVLRRKYDNWRNNLQKRFFKKDSNSMCNLINKCFCEDSFDTPKFNCLKLGSLLCIKTWYIK